MCRQLSIRSSVEGVLITLFTTFFFFSTWYVIFFFLGGGGATLIHSNHVVFIVGVSRG